MTATLPAKSDLLSIDVLVQQLYEEGVKISTPASPNILFLAKRRRSDLST